MDKEKEIEVAVFDYYSYLCPRLKNQIETLSEEGFNICIYLWNRGKSIEKEEHKYNIRWVRQWAPDRIENMWLWSFLFLPIYYLRLYLLINIDNKDIILCSHPFMLPFCVFVGSDKNIVYDCREMYSVKVSQSFPPVIDSVIAKSFIFTELILCRYVDYITTVDSRNAVVADKYRRVTDSVEVIYNVPKIQGNDELDSEIECIDEDDYIITYVGGLTKNKGVIKAIQTMDLVQDKHSNLYLIGHFVDSRENTINLVKEKGLEDQVHFTGRLEHSEMMGFLEKTDIALALYQPTEYYQKYSSTGTGRKFFNYMEAGVPILAPRFAEIGKVVQTENCGILVDSTDPNSILKGVDKLINNPNVRKEMGRRGKESVESKYNWGNEKEKLIKVYNKLVN
jgi:glycosyltransferase involved in cell wall biosynthesis